MASNHVYTGNGSLLDPNSTTSTELSATQMASQDDGRAEGKTTFGTDLVVAANIHSRTLRAEMEVSALGGLRGKGSGLVCPKWRNTCVIRIAHFPLLAKYRRFMTRPDVNANLVGRLVYMIDAERGFELGQERYMILQLLKYNMHRPQARALEEVLGLELCWPLRRTHPRVRLTQYARWGSLPLSSR